MIQKGKVRVVLTQGYCLLRHALVDRLKQEGWIELCGVASGLEEAREMIAEYKPHVLVMNISLKCSAGVSSMQKLKHDFFWLSIVAFSCDSEFENAYIGQALRAGADAYVSAEDSLEDLIDAIRYASEGRPFVGEATRQRRHEQLLNEEQLKRLSRREAEVFCLTGCGYVPQRIAQVMNLSVKTVESYRERIRGKMNFETGADLLYASTSFMRSAARRGMAVPDEEVVKELLSATA